MATTAFANGVAPIVGFGQQTIVTFSGTLNGFSNWTYGESWTIEGTSTAGDFTLGAGRISGKTIACGLATDQRCFIGIGTSFAFSAVADPAGWEKQDVGAGTINFTTSFGTDDVVTAFSTYQGKLAVFGQYSIQLWKTDADPNQFAKQQTLTNIGTTAPLSVSEYGGLDTFFLASSGFRSLRARETTLDAFVVDIGSAVDSLIQAYTAAQIALGCAILEPTEHRWWCHINGTIYVLSHFPSLKISAWSTYLPTYDVAGTQTAFTPEKFEVSGGLVLVRDTTGKIFIYGGTNGTTYDKAQCKVQTPFLDHGKPYQVKLADSIDVVVKGSWTIKAGMDPVTGTKETVWAPTASGSVDANVDSTLGPPKIPYKACGTHVTMYAETLATVSEAATIGMFAFHYKQLKEG